MGITISLSSKTSTSITIYAVGSTTASNPFDNHQYGYKKSGDPDYTPHGNYTVNTTYFEHYETFSGLSPDTSYDITGAVIYDDFTSDGDTITVTTDSSGPVRPGYWSWSSTSHAPGDPVTNLDASEWNDFCNHINAVRAYRGLSDYNFTTAISGNKIYAYMFNELVNAIDAMSPSTSSPTTVSSGSYFYGYYLDQLKEAINSID